MTDQLSLFTEPKTVKESQLNENQKLVLEYIKGNAGTQGHVLNSVKLVVDLSHFPNRRFCTEHSISVVNAYQTLSRVEQAQILQAFATWVLQEGADE